MLTDMSDDSLAAQIAALTDPERAELNAFVARQRVPLIDEYDLANLGDVRPEDVPRTSLDVTARRLNQGQRDEVLRKGLAYLREQRDNSMDG